MRLAPTGTPLPRRIEGEAAESAAGDFMPIIESADEAHLMRGQAERRCFTAAGAHEKGKKPANSDGNSDFRGEMHPSSIE